MTEHRAFTSNGPFGEPSRPEDAFLTTLAELARRDGRPLCRRLADEIDRLGPTRRKWKASRVPCVAQLDACLSRGPDDMAYLRGAIAGMKDGLNWTTCPVDPALGGFNRHHGYCTLVGEDGRVPSDRLLVGLFLIDPNIHYPHHYHAADELYLPVSDPIAIQALGRPGSVLRQPGRFVQMPSRTTHALWTGERATLLVWAWMGDLTGEFRIGSRREL